MTLKELLGTNYKDGMTVEEAEEALKGKNLVDLSNGEYVSKSKYTDDTKLLAQYKAAVEGKQAEIDKAVEAAKAAAKTEYEKEYEKKLEAERTADKRKRAKEKHYTGLTDEQKGVFDAFIKDDDLKLADDGESFSNFEELSKSVKEKYKTLFPADPNGSNKKAGLGGDDGGTGGKGGDEFADLRKIR